jgi:hypothetical protein
MQTYMGYKITSVAPEAGKFTANIERIDAKGNQEQIALSADSAEGAVDAAKRLVRLAVNNKLPLNLAMQVAGF